MNRPKTIFIDIDGTLLYHYGSQSQQIQNPPKLLPLVKEKLDKWDLQGYNIILTTGRKESLRQITEKQLSDIGIFFDQLIMGIGGGTRVLINDRKTNSQEDTAIAINITRNEGLINVEI
jgi:hypothetical protein